MKLIKPSIEFLWMTANPLQMIEAAGRTAYKSEKNITEDSTKDFIRHLLKRGHESVIEHASMSYRIICDRGVSHEIVRHRLFSYTQESTRYCDYSGGVTFIIPPWTKLEIGEFFKRRQWDISKSLDSVWFNHILDCEDAYKYLLSKNWTPQQARAVLPNSLKTEIVVTGNFREWHHFFKLRTAKEAHPQMQEVAKMILTDVWTRVEEVFDEYPN